MKKIVSILIMIMLGYISIILIADNDFNVEGSSEGEEENYELNLPYDYAWSRILDNLSYVVHNDSIWGEGDEVIRKGRNFGTEGDNWTADYIKKELTKLDLSNVQMLQLGPIADKPMWKYTSKVEVVDFNLTINFQGDLPYFIPSDGHIPKNETFAFPSARPNRKRFPLSEYLNMSYNNTFNNVRIISKDIDKSYLSYGATTDYYLNISNIIDLNDFSNVSGNVTYIINGTLPDDQEGRVFLFDEENGCENQLDNLTNASGVILIHNNTQGGSNYYTDYNFSNITIQCARVNKTSSNLIAIVEKLENNTIIVMDNSVDNQTLTFFYNFAHILSWWPTYDFFILVNDYNDVENLYSRAFNIWILNPIIQLPTFWPRGWCHGLIFYENSQYDVHNMDSSSRFWMGRAYNFLGRQIFYYGFNSPAVQVFSVNKSVGEFLENNLSDPSCNVSGYFEQNFTEEIHWPPWDPEQWTAGVKAYNVEGNITIDQSPNDAIIILESRPDAWWGECPGDSGVGTGIMMGIAKYIKDNNLTPKYNLTFLFTTGEEYGMRGAWHYSHSHPENEFNIIRWIGTDQLGFLPYPGSSTNLTAQSKYYFDNLTISNIMDKSDYDSRTGYGISNDWLSFLKSGMSQTNDVAWIDRCKTIVFLKTGGGFLRHHKAGINYEEGDSMKYMDRNDTNVTFEVIWNATRYYCFDSDCWFKDISFTPYDSNSDSINDSVNVTFTVNTSFPHDRVMVKAVLISQDHPVLCRFSEDKNYIVTSTSGVNDTLSVELLNRSPEGYYKLRVYLFNSTGEVDNDVFNPYEFEFLNKAHANITFETEEFYLHPPNSAPDTPSAPSGDTSVKAGKKALYTVNTTDPEGDKIWYQWCWNTSWGFDYYTRWIMGGPYDSGVNCTRNIEWELPGTYNVSVRAKDNFFNPNVMSGWSPELTVIVTEGDEGSSSSNNLLLGAFSSTELLPQEQTSCNGFAEGVFIESSTRGSLSWNWDFGDGSSSDEENVVHNYSSVGNYTVNLTITNNEGYTYNHTTNISVLILKANFSTSDVLQPNVTIFFNDTSDGYYDITNWTWDFRDGNMSYQQNTSHTYPVSGAYNVSLTVKDEENNSHTRYKSIFVESVLPDFVSVISSPSVVGFDSDVTIVADFFDNQSMVNGVIVNMIYPDNSSENFTMGVNFSLPYDYVLVFNDTWQVGVYNYSVYVLDNAGNVNCASGFNFTVSAQANISVCTNKDEYGSNENIYLTDPPSEKPLGPISYELLDNGSVLRLWNRFDSYFFNTSNGLQFTNHFNKYWSHNVLMLGYYNNDQWNLVYRVDELSGFNKNVVSDTETFVNVTLWKDLTYQGYNFRLAIRYFLGVDDNELTVIPYIKNLGIEIPYVLGFAWELKDIQVDMTPENDYIEINGTSFYLNQSLDETYNNLSESRFYIKEDFVGNESESLYLCWDKNLFYKVQVKSRDGQYNAPVTLGIKIGTLGVGQEKYTCLFWHDASEVVYYFNSHPSGEGEVWETNPGYMVDGNESTFASTSVDGDVELLDGSTVSESRNGTIVKVELRCKGYRSGFGVGSENIVLRPVFSGVDGDNYSYCAGSSAAWSVWFDITNDSQGPGVFSQWTWDDVIVLDCDVESDLGSGYTLYCSKVEVRVTYNPYSGPEFSNPYPADGSMGVPITPLLNITVNHPLGSVMNISWFSNCSGSWVLFGVNNSVYNGTYYQLFSNATSNGFWWYWMVNASDGDVYNESGVFMFYTGNQSKIVNTGVTNFSGYLLMQVDYLEGEEWVLDSEVVNETGVETVTVGGQLGLDSFFNDLVNTDDLSHGSGTYRVYAAFRDPNGDVLVCDDDSLLEATYEFTVTFAE